MRADEVCPCGSGDQFGSCCLPLLVSERQAETAEELMRSRYSAYVVGDTDYLWRTWHPRTRPPEVTEVTVTWTRLEIVDRVAGGRGDLVGGVEFRAHHQAGVLHERSRFEVRGGRWFYVDGEFD
jgi:SEC-C motif domain protein